MKKLIAICLVCILTAAAAQGIIITFDENNHSDYSYDGITKYPLLCDFFSCPVYEFPKDLGLLVEGYVVIYEPRSNGQEISDVLRFFNAIKYLAETATWDIVPAVFVYSKQEPGQPASMADYPGIFSLPPPYHNAVEITECGLEGGLNGVEYVPQVNPETGPPGVQPGFFYETGEPVIYRFISDVPEPATIYLLASGSLALIKRKK